MITNDGYVLVSSDDELSPWQHESRHNILSSSLLLVFHFDSSRVSSAVTERLDVAAMSRHLMLTRHAWPSRVLVVTFCCCSSSYSCLMLVCVPKGGDYARSSVPRLPAVYQPEAIPYTRDIFVFSVSTSHEKTREKHRTPKTFRTASPGQHQPVLLRWVSLYARYSSAKLDQTTVTCKVHKVIGKVLRLRQQALASARTFLHVRQTRVAFLSRSRIETSLW